MLGTLFINLSSCLHYWFYKKETQYIQSQILAPIANTPFMLNSCVRCKGPNGPGGPLGLGLGIRLNPYLGVK
jgi:hypothetical protein